MTTAGWIGSTSRLTIVWKSRMASAARTIGSTVRFGQAPWPPFPRMVTESEVELARSGPPRYRTTPAGSFEWQCSARAKSGLGKRLYRPSASMLRAPPMASSAGWATITTVPLQRFLCSVSHRAVPMKQVMCTSWPQACITPTSRPCESRALTLLA